MPVPYTYDGDRNTVDCRPHGSVAISEVAGFFEAVRVDGSVRQGAVEVVFLDGVDEFHFSSNEAQLIPMKISELRREKGLFATIFVAEGDMQFGMARMFTTLHELADERYSVEIIRDASRVDATLAGLRGLGEHVPD